MNALVVAIIVGLPFYLVIREVFRRYVAGQLSAHGASLAAAAGCGCLALAPVVFGLTSLNPGYVLLTLMFATSGYLAGRLIAALAPRDNR